MKLKVRVTRAYYKEAVLDVELPEGADPAEVERSFRLNGKMLEAANKALQTEKLRAVPQGIQFTVVKAYQTELN